LDGQHVDVAQPRYDLASRQRLSYDEEPRQRFALRSVDGVDVEVTCMSLAEVEEALRSGNQFVTEALTRGVVVYGDEEELKELLRRAQLGGAPRGRVSEHTS